MGALAPISPWIPEDDLLLKNAVEAGASLESLAKGAVQFSRRFTIRELQERWQSLLYDPDISAEASARMIEFERSTSNVTSKSSRVESSKESKGDRKRKFESVRRCYYAMRKRICTDPLNQSGLNFLVAPAENCFGNGNEAGGPSNNLGDPMGDHFQLGNTNYDDLHHVFHQDVGNSVDGASHEFENGDGGRVENGPIEQRHICDEIPQVVDRNMSLSGNCTAVGAVDSPKQIPLHNPFEDKIDMNPMSNGDNNNNSMYPGLEGNHVFNSPVSECEASFHHLQYSSPPPPMSVWRNMESMSVMEISGASQLGGKNPQAGNAFGIPGGASKRSSGYDIVNSETGFQSHIACDEIKTSTSCTQFDLVADTLLNLSDDEMLLMDDDGKVIDKYGLSNLLLDSPADVNEDQMLNVTEADTSVVTVADLRLPSGESADQVDKGVNDLDTSGLVPTLEEQKPSSISDIKTQLPELCNGVICCTLNAEDLEVPFNDDVIFPGKSCLASLNRRGFNELSHHALSVKDISNKQASETGLSLVNREMKKFEELHADLHARGQTVGFKHASEFDAKFELAKSESISTNSRHPGTASCSTLVVKEVGSETLCGKQSCSDLPGLPVKVSEGFNSHFETCGLGVKQEGQVIPTVKKSEVHTQLGTTDEIAPEPTGEPLLSDIEEQFSDNDSDIPYFSDIESMILDMDLGPEDLDSYSSKQVAMYQSEDAKRAIIRLEQSAHAYMQRAISSHGAFAVLYGRHSKHYIKKPEVLLGRATEDVIVDIDLGKEGRANKISRRQAIIKMDEDGVFHLRNLGRCPISVDNKEVYPGQSLVLHSNCLIEVREMPFIFEKTQARVKRCLDATASKMPPK